MTPRDRDPRPLHLRAAEYHLLGRQLQITGPDRTRLPIPSQPDERAKRPDENPPSQG